MTTEPQQRRMTQQSRRQLEAADTVTVRAQRGGGYAIELFKINRDKNCMDYVSTVCASDGPMLYPAPSAAVRAIRRIRPDLPDEEIPLVHDVRKGAPETRQTPGRRMVHIVTTSHAHDADTIGEALCDAGIEEASVSPLHLQRAARLAALVLAEYPPEQRASARDTLDRWIAESLEVADEH